MHQIPADMIDKTWEQLANMPPQKAPKLINLMTKRQPVILAYLMTSGEDILNQDEKELLLFMGVIIWQIVSQEVKVLPRVTEHLLEEIEASNMRMFENLEKESEAGFEAIVENIVTTYNQSNLLKGVVEALMEDPEEDTLIRDEYKGLIFFCLKTVIDCFDQFDLPRTTRR